MTMALECVGKGQNGLIKILEDAVELPRRDVGDPKRGSGNRVDE